MSGRIPSGDVQLAVCNGRNIYVMVYQQSLRRNFKSKAFYVMNNIHVDVLLPLIMSNCCNGSCWIIGSGANTDWELSWITSHFGRTVEVIFFKERQPKPLLSNCLLRLLREARRRLSQDMWRWAPLPLSLCRWLLGALSFSLTHHSDWGSEAASKYWAAAISIWLPRQRRSRIMELQSYKYEVHLKLLWMNLAICGGRNVVAEGNFS